MKVLADRIAGLEIAKGQVPQHSSINKFGQAIQIDVADGFVDVWDGADNTLGTGKIPHYTYSTNADIDSVSSSDDNDEQPIEILGLSETWIRVHQIITLQGHTRVALDIPLIRVYRMYNSGAPDLIGDVYCYVNSAIVDGIPAVTSNVRAIIKNGNNQTLMALYTIPSQVSGYLASFDAYVSQKKDQLSDIQLRFRPFGGVFLLKRPISVGSGAPPMRPFVFPEFAAAKTDIVIRADTSKDGGSIAAGFDLALVDDLS